jgi:hypothetical protein
MSEQAVHRDELERVVREYGPMDRSDLPGWLLNPQGEREFSLALAVVIAQRGPEHAGPEYDDQGYLTGWHGIALKGQPGGASA